MRKIIISVAIMSLLTACGEKPTQEKADYAVISGKVSIPENQKIQLILNNEVLKEIPVGTDGSFRDTIRPITENRR